MHYSAVIVGAGPGGLACAKKLAKHGVSVIVIERKPEIGSKVCAGGITWSGLIGLVPRELIERSFPQQHIKTRFQRIRISSPTPIIATVNRKKLGQCMANEAESAGASFLTSSYLQSIEKNTVKVLNKTTGKVRTFSFDYLIGADGSQSVVRKYLKVPSEKAGIGINFQISQIRKNMEWHLNTTYFLNGYGWIFPHGDTTSIGAYVDKEVMPARLLKENLLKWGADHGINLQSEKCAAELINYDYQGWDFGNIFLVGDAAGFASALTGEGIYPAIVSGETVAEKILNPHCDLSRLNRMIKKQKTFRRLVKLTGKNSFICSFLAEMGLILLRLKILKFQHLEMGH